jgi:hypothetical protein
MRMRWQARLALVVGALLIAVPILLSSNVRGNAATLEARWSLLDRANATSFVPGANGTNAGYEIVSLGAAGPSTALSTYRYGGPDFTPPMTPIVSCTGSISAASLNLDVSGAYPYAGCVFFVGVTNSGDGAIRVSLGSLDANATVTCDKPGCQASDVDMVAGGPTAAEANALCRTSGTVTNTEGTAYTLAPGAVLACPLFVTVLQPAKEGATYVVRITPPPLESQHEPVVLVPGAPSDPGIGSEASPSASAEPSTPTPTATPTATPTRVPTDVVEGARTPGAGAGSTPHPPSTGTGVLIQRSSAAGGPLPIVLMALGVALLLFVAWPRERR